MKHKHRSELLVGVVIHRGRREGIPSRAKEIGRHGCSGRPTRPFNAKSLHSNILIGRTALVVLEKEGIIGLSTARKITETLLPFASRREHCG